MSLIAWRFRTPKRFWTAARSSVPVQLEMEKAFFH
jgi:hypothetical protein